MLKYLIQDMAGMLHYIPYIFAVGTLLVFLVQMINIRRQKQGKEPQKLVPTVCFYTYLGVLVIITFLSRESGNVSEMDWKIGSTLSINVRNDAFLIENILLFMPYGFCLSWYRNHKSNWLQSFMIGFLTSLCIELMQYVTGRGVFQIDDILTNTLGCLLGAIIFKFMNWCFRK